MDLNFSLTKQGQCLIEAQLSIPLGINAIGIFGPSGAGKTSFLRCLAGLENRMAGNIELGGPNVGNIKVGLVFQDGALFPHLTVEQNLTLAERFAAAASSNRGYPSRAAIVEALELEHIFTSSIEQLSGGEKQRVAIARALINRPDILLLDEAFSALDLRLKHKVIQFLATLSPSGLRLVVVSHQLQDLALLCDYILVVERNKVKQAGAVADILPTLQTQQNSLLEHIPHTSGIFALLIATPIEQQPNSCVDANTNTEPRSFALGDYSLVSHTYTQIGQQAKIWVNASQVVISTKTLPSSSLVNRLPVILESSAPHNQTTLLLTLRIDIALNEPQQLFALLDKQTAMTLNLQSGQALQAYFATH